ncbi:MAG: murein biosynthesis integral membrane protein MurJ [Candidatus Eisenbacteria bacterium RBG_16_71_46]|nr:MAG: murein biosynthesis integral membrane protein MurJ [Candidatus Eisenbacteria bacterium RBG_16_71_46]OGF21869.1 MAG: murein biosynthesis integral membrane protein MurJ [Candidatus Eisenbacteria bacterium RBG_19FT_COMBO_70_11]
MSEERRVARTAGTVGAATLLSRLLGLVREQVMATVFGAGFATDAFNVAFRIPNLLRDLFAEGAMSAAFVPTFTEYLEKRGEAEAWALGRQVLLTLFVVLAVACVVGYLLAPWLVVLFAPGFGAVPGKIDLTVLLTRVMLPFLPAVALAAACMGMLNARGVFAVPALAPTLLNIGMVAFGLALIPVCQALGLPAILAMAVGVVIGGFMQLGFQLPSLARQGFRFRLEAPTLPPGVRRVGWLMAPATIGLAATQINLLVSTVIASMLQQGSVSWLWYAFRIMQLPIGVFGVALATVSLPELARAAVAQDMPRLKSTFSATLRLVILLTVPAAMWLAATSGPVIALLYEHGRFQDFDTRQTAAALVMYCIGLPAFAGVTVSARAFYAMGDTRTPVQVSFVSVAINLVLNLALMRPLGHLGLALATSVTSTISLLQLGWYLRRRIGPLEGRRMLATLLRVGAASVTGVAPCAIGLLLLRGAWHRGFAWEAATVAASAAVALAIGYVAMKLFGVEELHALEDLARGVRSRLFGPRGR